MSAYLNSFIIETRSDDNGATIRQIYDQFGYYPSKEILKALINFCVDSLEDFDQTDDHNNYLDECREKCLDPSTGEPYESCNKREAPSPSPKIGYLYLAVDDAIPGVIKIGFSKNPQVRETTLQAEKPTIRIVWDEEGTMAEERSLHKHFHEKRVRGEWFRLTEEEAFKGMQEVLPHPRPHHKFYEVEDSPPFTRDYEPFFDDIFPLTPATNG